MFTDMIAEEELKIKEEEPWYDRRDLENDLYLAAKLGKTLLERNQELEEGLQRMYTTNKEQLQEIEHLSKQVEMLRSVNDEHAKGYEQLDATAQDLERSNRRLSLENRSAQHKIKELTETVSVLQVQVEELQKEIEKMIPDLLNPQKSDVCPSNNYPPSEPYVSASRPSIQEHELEEEEHTALLHSIQAQLISERTRRETAEQEAGALAQEIRELESCVALLEGYKARLVEMDAEVDELRQLVCSNSASRMLSNTLFFHSEEDTSEILETGQMLQCLYSDRERQEAGGKDEELKNGEHISITSRGHFERVKSSGESLLNEMSAQYDTLQIKYNALLHNCGNDLQSQCDKAVQTAIVDQESVMYTCSQNCTELPEYKLLFNQIFTYIQNSKKDLEKNRVKSS